MNSRYRKYAIEPMTLTAQDIVALRQKLGLSQVQLDCEIGLEIGATGQVERSTRALSIALNKRYANALERLLDRADAAKKIVADRLGTKPPKPMLPSRDLPALGVTSNQPRVRVPQVNPATGKALIRISSTPSLMEQKYDPRLKPRLKTGVDNGKM
jgi:transcriptional regulator with XRE-family HTH domain